MQFDAVALDVSCVSPFIKTEQKGNVGFITLDRPDAYNALNMEMVQALRAILTLWKTDSNVHLVCMDSSTSKAFCAGGDIRQVATLDDIAHSAEVSKFFAAEYALNALIHSYPKPFVSLIQGIVMGGGVGISLPGRFQVISEDVTWAMPEVMIGLYPDVGSLYYLRRLPECIGLYAALTGARFTTMDVMHLGLATHFVPYEQFDVLKETLVQASTHQGSHGIVAEILSYFGQMVGGEAPIQKQALTISDVFSHKTLEESMVALEQYAGDPWADDTMDQLMEACPLSLAVTWDAYHAAKGKSFDQVLELNHKLSNWLARDPNFYEGVRAMIIDKDRAPRWYPSNLCDIDRKKIDLLLRS